MALNWQVRRVFGGVSQLDYSPRGSEILLPMVKRKYTKMIEANNKVSKMGKMVLTLEDHAL